MRKSDPIADEEFRRHNHFMTLRDKAHLREALEEIYREFAAPTPSVIEGCPCCIATRGVDVLLNTPLREITGQQIWRYVSGAFLTIGNEDDFRYLLPRILEISVTDPGNANDPEIVIGKLGLASWREWKANEQRTIERLLDAWFYDALVNDLDNAKDGWTSWETESVLCGSARAGLALERWTGPLQEPSSAPVLADLRLRFPKDLSGFWSDAPTGLKELAMIISDGRA
ncbi:hypothetical protein [Tsuneonella mangrovi]|uniref:hypothetical protein n=1 Tax=Tsuneonella mangrovi TaxID=1982042 RepID=UPI0012374B89|nr:hypothetical protein [Tsuneonella mangrovi]